MRLPFLLLLLSGVSAYAQQQTLFQGLHVNKKPGQETGPALITLDGKMKSISNHAYQAWPIMQDRNALVIALEPKNPSGHYRLRYVDGESRKRRDLGSVPFTSAVLDQQQQADGSWVFVLSGIANSQPDIFVADVNGVPGRIQNASHPRLTAGSLSWLDISSGQTKTSAFPILLGQDFRGIYHAEANGGEYAQFLPDGRAVITRPDNNQYRTGTWSTNGTDMRVALPDHQYLDLPRTDLHPIAGVPAGTRLIVRLLQPLSSHTAHVNDPVESALISPASVNGITFLPQGSVFHGIITKAHGVGWAVKHETAALTVDFSAVKLPDGQTLAIHTLLQQVENSQETVTKNGRIQGIRSTGTLGHSAESKIASVASFDPIAYLFTTVSSTAALGFAESEILYPAGTELMLEVESPVITSKTFSPNVPTLANSQAEQDKLIQFVRALPFRTMTKGTNKPSDLTNLVFLGAPAAIQRAFEAAGWVPTDQLTAHSTFTTLRTLGGNQSYKQAPMSVLLLDERQPIFALTKTTNTFNSRHHIRIFNPDASFEDAPALTASSTQDIGIAFSSQRKTFIHVIDQHIDNERSKVVNDLEFTGCVQAAELIPRPWVPKDAYNSTGDKLQTDSGIAVLRLSDCTAPRKSSSEDAVRPNRFERVTRDTMLTLRNDVVRGNVGYQGYSVSKLGYNYFAHKDELKPDTGAWQMTDLSGARFKGLGTLPAGQPSARPRLSQSQTSRPDPSVIADQESHRWDPAKYEIGINGGYLFYPNSRSEAGDILLLPKDLTSGLPPLGAIFADEIGGGFSAGIYFRVSS